jgi:endonuclease/exonuclease/phosphatase family metal-dependent hydrolase
MNKFRFYIEAFQKKLSRFEWIVKLLNLPRCSLDEPGCGFIVVQIDGLAYTQMKKALQKNRLPFIRQLIQKRDHSLKQFYSGLPSSTPAVQGELFFGIKSSVPAFEFIDRRKGERYAMFYPESAKHVANILESQGETLLKGGTSYSNIYAGGADEARYCAETMDLESILKAASPVKILLILFFHIGKIFRILAYALVEWGLAVNDFVRGVVERKNVFKELKFIPTRILVCIILRELIRFRVKMDTARGIRIIHANFVGYDEQAHRRGPDSAFAHWTLKGIDAAIKDIYQTSLRSECREYHIIIYSDHGQESVQPYEKRYGKPLKKAVRETLMNMDVELLDENSGVSNDQDYNHRHRMRGLFYKNRVYRQKQPEPTVQPEKIQITTMGPIGHIYLPFSVSDDQKEMFAKRLVKKSNIPQVFFIKLNQIFAVNQNGIFNLLKESQEVLGKDHPFLKWTAEDLQNICRHPNAGDLIISGWFPGHAPLSFNIENGAHGGPGREETRGFVLLSDTIEAQKFALRPLDLRRNILNSFKDRNEDKTIRHCRKDSHVLKVMTYNIHSCVDMKGRVDIEKIEKVIANLDPDVVALQEVDVNRRRTLYMDQAKRLAEGLNMDYQYYSLMNSGSEKYGLAILAKFPLIKIKYDRFPAVKSKRMVERRGAMWVRIQTPLGDVNVINTHLGLHMKERLFQIRTLLGKDWLSGVLGKKPLVICGDFNAGAQSPVYREICAHLADAQKMGNYKGYPKNTFFSRYPVLRLDHIFVSKQFATLRRVRVPSDAVTRIASDHLPVFAEFTFNESAGD